MSLNEYQSEASLKSAIFGEMRKRGADLMEASYSGGNDEGGVDGIKLFKLVVEKKLELAFDEDYDGPLWSAVDDLLSIEFGTWAGEFSASGTVIAKLAERTVVRDGVMQSGYDSDYAEY